MAANKESWAVGDAVWVAVFGEPKRPRLITAYQAIVTAVENDDVTVDAVVPTRTGQRHVVRTVYASDLWDGNAPLEEAEDELAGTAWPLAEDRAAAQQQAQGDIYAIPERSFWAPP
jgi:hypothetical protein